MFVLLLPLLLTGICLAEDQHNDYDPSLMVMICERLLWKDCSQFQQHQTCGTDGMTYENSCYFSVANCNNTALHVSHMGACGSKPSDPNNPVVHGQHLNFLFFCEHVSHETCPFDYDPICGSDGRTHRNICDFGKDSCMNFGMTIAHYGECHHH